MPRLLTDGPRILVVFGMVISLSIFVVLCGTLVIKASHYDGYPFTVRDVWQLILVPLLCSHGYLLGIVLPLSAKAVPWRLVAVAAMLAGGICIAQLYREEMIYLAFVILFIQMLSASLLGLILH